MTQFTAIKATDITNKAYPSCAIGLGTVRADKEPRFIDWMRQANLRRSTNFQSYQKDFPEYLGANGLPTSFVESDTGYRVMFQEGPWSDTNQVSTINFRVFHPDATLSTFFNVTVVDASVPGQTDIAMTIPEGGKDASFVVTPSNLATHTGVNIIETEFLSNWQAGEIFRPTWLSLISQFAMVRFMDWQETNGSQVSNYSELFTKDRLIWAGHEGISGVPLEVCCNVCRDADVMGWFCIPHLLSDADVQLWAEELVEHYPAHLPIAKVEYSNEKWNNQFAQSVWAGQQALALWGADNATTRPSFYGMRSTQVMQIVRSVFDAAGRGHQLRCVLGVQTADTNRTKAAIDAPSWLLNDPDNYVNPASVHDSIGVTGYFGEGKYLFQDHGQEILDDLAANGLASASALMNTYIGHDLPNLRARLTAQADIAKQRGLRLDMYEGNQHVDTGSSKNGENNSPFWNSTILTSGVGTAFTVGEMVLVDSTHLMKVLSTAADRIVVGGAPSINVGESVVGQDSGASQTVVAWENQVLADGVEDLIKEALWSQAQADLQDAARDIWREVGGDWYNHFLDIAPFSAGGNWGTKRSWDHVSKPWDALALWNFLNPRWFFA